VKKIKKIKKKVFRQSGLSILNAASNHFDKKKEKRKMLE